MAKLYFVLVLLLSSPVVLAQPQAERVAEAFAEVWLNTEGCAWTLRSIFGGGAPSERVYYDYEYDAWGGTGFLLKYRDAPVRLGLSWSDNVLRWETSFQSMRQLKEAHGLRGFMEEHELFRQRLENDHVSELLEATIRFFEVMEEWGRHVRPSHPDPRFQELASRVNAIMGRWDWPAKGAVLARLSGQSSRWAPAAFRHTRESEVETFFVDATAARLTLIRRETRDQSGAWSTTCRLRAEPVGGMGIRTLEDFAGEYLRYLATYGYGRDLLTEDDPDPFPYTASWLSPRL